MVSPPLIQHTLPSLLGRHIRNITPVLRLNHPSPIIAQLQSP
jgi:hypothetical protein